MGNNILLSIVIPVYNVRFYVEECLESIQVVANENIEIICVNDGSTDGSELICKEYNQNFKNVKCIDQENQGLSAARNTGIKCASGDYIMFLDSDDYLYQGALKKIICDIRESQNVDMFCGRAYEFCDGHKEYSLCQTDYSLLKSEKPVQIFKELDSNKKFWFAAWLLIVKREFLLDNSLFFKNGIYHEDELWVPQVFLQANTIKMLNYGFYCYRTNRQGSIVSAPNIKREFDKLIIIDEFDKLNVIGTEKKQLVNNRQASLVFGIILHLQSLKKDKKYSSLIAMLKKYLIKMKHGKYRLIYYITLICGIEKCSYIFGKKLVNNEGSNNEKNSN